MLLLRLDRLQGCSPKARLDAKATRTVGQHRVQVWSAGCCCGSIGDIFIIGHELRPVPIFDLKSQHLRQNTSIHSTSTCLPFDIIRLNTAIRYPTILTRYPRSQQCAFLRSTSCAAGLQQEAGRRYSPPRSYRPDQRLNQHRESYARSDTRNQKAIVNKVNRRGFILPWSPGPSLTTH